MSPGASPLFAGSPRQMLRTGVTLANVSINPVTMRRTSKHAKAVARWMGVGPLVSVRRQPYAPQGWCYLNVQEHCLRYGGEVVIGWAMFIEPDAFVCAVHHTIWRSPQGELIDIRILDEGDSGPMTFIIDPTPLEIFADAPTVGITWARTKTPHYLAIGRDRRFAEALVDDQILEHEQAADDLFVAVLPQFSQALLGVTKSLDASALSYTNPLEVVTFLRDKDNHHQIRSGLLRHSDDHCGRRGSII